MLLPCQTEVTRPAVPAEARGLVEELQQAGPAAPRRVHGVLPQRLKALHRRRPRLRTQLPKVEFVLVPDEVLRVGVHYTLGRQAVATRPSDLLVILLHRLAPSPVDHPSYVRLVDAHPERDGGDDDGGASHEEVGVGLVAHGQGQSGVVRPDVPGRDLLGQGPIDRAGGGAREDLPDDGRGDRGGDLVDLALRRAVHDGAPGRRRAAARAPRGDYGPGDLRGDGVEGSGDARAGAPPDRDPEVGPVEALPGHESVGTEA